MAVTGSEQSARLPVWASLLEAWTRLKARVLDAEHLMVQRLSRTVFLIRVASAVLAFGSQVLLARWMGSFEFGIYVYVWTWVLLLGQVIDLGLGTAAQRFIPEYRERGMLGLLRGFDFGSRWFATLIALGVALVCAGLVWLLEPWLDRYLLIPLYLACLTLPAYALEQRPGRHLAQLRLDRPLDDAGLYRPPVAAHRPDGGRLLREPADGCGHRDDRRRAVDLAAGARPAGAC